MLAAAASWTASGSEISTRCVSAAGARAVAGDVDADGAVVLEVLDTTVAAVVVVVDAGSACLLLAHPARAAASSNTATATPTPRLAEDTGMAE